MRSGNVHLDRDYLRNADRRGLYWSTTTNEDGSNNAYYLNFTPTDVAPSTNDDRYVGFSLRCLQE